MASSFLLVHTGPTSSLRWAERRGTHTDAVVSGLLEDQSIRAGTLAIERPAYPLLRYAALRPLVSQLAHRSEERLHGLPEQG